MKIRRIILFIPLFLLLPPEGNARQDSSGFSFLKRGSYFEQIILDPTECQTSAGLLKIWRSGTQDNGIYIPVNLGIQQSIVRYDFHASSGLELGFAGAIFTQFTIRKMEGNTYLGEMENADYKISILLNYRIRRLSLRLRAFHTSSHLADDYILRNNITEPNPGTLNYEQLDLISSYQLNKFRVYAGFGLVVTPNAVRERFSIQTGFHYRKDLNSKGNFRLVAGTDIKIFQENDYSPNVRSGLGFEFGNAESMHAGFMIDYYTGHLPYSVMEYEKVNWFGFRIILLRSRIK